MKDLEESVVYSQGQFYFQNNEGILVSPVINVEHSYERFCKPKCHKMKCAHCFFCTLSLHFYERPTLLHDSFHKSKNSICFFVVVFFLVKTGGDESLL